MISHQGAAAFEMKAFWKWATGALVVLLAGTAQAQTFTINGNLSSTGTTTATTLNATNTTSNTLNVTGATTLKSLNATGTTSNTLNVTGATTLKSLNATDTTSNTLNVTGATTLKSLNATDTTLSSLGVTGTVVIPTTTNTPKNPCTPGQLLLGPGGSGSNGKGGWFFFCRLGGTWAAADFSNEGAAAEEKLALQKLAAEVAELRQQVESLRRVACASGSKDAACAQGAR